MQNPVYTSIDVRPFRFHFCPEYHLCSSKIGFDNFDCSQCDLQAQSAGKSHSLWELTSYADFIKSIQ